MPTLRFYKVSPGGNPTILILDPVDKALHADVARNLLSDTHLQAEQVGYLDMTANPVRLDMMGGEFCGNACRAATAVMLHEGIGLHGGCGGTWSGLLSTSGVDRPVRVNVAGTGSHREYWTEIPLPARNAVTACAPGIGAVHLPGISHLCLDETRHSFPVDYVSAAHELRAAFGLEKIAAAGCIWYGQADGRTSTQIKPVVWVRDTNSTYWETACGSGSLALALWLDYGKNFPIRRHVIQPSGETIGVEIDTQDAWIFGQVRVIARGHAYL